MAYFETAFGLTIKEILEVIVVVISLVLLYFSNKAFVNLKAEKSKYSDAFKLISLGFLFFFISMLFELIDSFYLDYIFDNLQLLTGIIAFIFLLIGFRDGFGAANKGGKANA